MFHFIYLDIKQHKICRRFVFELWHIKDMNNFMPIFSKVSRAEVSNNKVYYIVADDYDIF